MRHKSDAPTVTSYRPASPAPTISTESRHVASSEMSSTLAPSEPASPGPESPLTPYKRKRAPVVTISVSSDRADAVASTVGNETLMSQDEPNVGALAKRLWEGIATEVSLEKTAKWLTHGTPSRHQILLQYFRLFEISHLRIDDALRCVCSKLALFELESQALDRLIEAFAGRYFESNPDRQGLLKSEVLTYQLAYSLVLLNTDLHKANTGANRDSAMSKRAYIDNTMSAISSIKSQDEPADQQGSPELRKRKWKLEMEELLADLYRSIRSRKLPTPTPINLVTNRPSTSSEVSSTSVSASTHQTGRRLSITSTITSSTSRSSIASGSQDSKVRDSTDSLAHCSFGSLSAVISSKPKETNARRGLWDGLLTRRVRSPWSSSSTASRSDLEAQRSVTKTDAQKKLPGACNDMLLSEDRRSKTSQDFIQNGKPPLQIDTPENAIRWEGFVEMKHLKTSPTVRASDRKWKRHWAVVVAEDKIGAKPELRLWRVVPSGTMKEGAGLRRVLVGKDLVDGQLNDSAGSIGLSKSKSLEWTVSMSSKRMGNDERSHPDPMQSTGGLALPKSRPTSLFRSLSSTSARRVIDTPAPTFVKSDYTALLLLDSLALFPAPNGSSSVSTRHPNSLHLRLHSGAEYLLSCSSEERVQSLQQTCNSWAARRSKEPLGGGIGNGFFGWSGSAPGRKIEEWKEPTSGGFPSQLHGQEQRDSMKRCLTRAKADLDKHTIHKGDVDKLLNSPTHNRAIDNWSRREAFLKRELLRYEVYVQLLEMWSLLWEAETSQRSTLGCNGQPDLMVSKSGKCRPRILATTFTGSEASSPPLNGLHGDEKVNERSCGELFALPPTPVSLTSV